MQQLTRSMYQPSAVALAPANTSAYLSVNAWRDCIHDLGNLIQVASSAISIIGRGSGPSDDDQARMIMSAARSSLERAAFIIRTSLRDVRECPANGRAVLSECFGHLGMLAAPLVGSGIVLDIELSPDLPAIGCDADCLEKALLNLLINARDAMPDGGHVWMRARVDGTHLSLTVEDDGDGMSPAQLSRAAEPFYTTKADGSGVGLATVRDLMGRVGGVLVIASEQGIGTCIELRFPIQARLRSSVPDEHCLAGAPAI